MLGHQGLRVSENGAAADDRSERIGRSNVDHHLISNEGGIARLITAGAHLVLCHLDKRPMWVRWQKRRPDAGVAQRHLEGDDGLLGVIPWSLHSTALDVDQGDPHELFDNFAPWADVPSRRGRHFYFDDDQPRRNSKWEAYGCSGDVRSGRGFLILHRDGPERLADALASRKVGAHRLPLDLFELVGYEPVLREPKPKTSIARQPAVVASPINVNLELTRVGRRNIALFDVVRMWAYMQVKGRTIAAWSETVGQYANEQNRRFPAPLRPDEVRMLAWNVASWTWCGGGPLDHGYEAQSRRGQASGKVRRFTTYDRDVAIMARLAAGDRQIDVARAFGVSQGTVSYTRGRLERRRRAPRKYQRT